MAATHDKEKQLTREIAPKVESALPGTEVLAVELTSPERFTVSSRLSLARASVSPTDSTGAAPSKNSRLATNRSITVGGQKGRAASWTRTASPSIWLRPARTESARSLPPRCSADSTSASAC